MCLKDQKYLSFTSEKTKYKSMKNTQFMKLTLKLNSLMLYNRNENDIQANSIYNSSNSEIHNKRRMINKIIKNLIEIKSPIQHQLICKIPFQISVYFFSQLCTSTSTFLLLINFEKYSINM